MRGDGLGAEQVVLRRHGRLGRQRQGGHHLGAAGDRLVEAGAVVADRRGDVEVAVGQGQHRLVAPTSSLNRCQPRRGGGGQLRLLVRRLVGGDRLGRGERLARRGRRLLAVAGGSAGAGSCPGTLGSGVEGARRVADREARQRVQDGGVHQPAVRRGAGGVGHVEDAVEAAALREPLRPALGAGRPRRPRRTRRGCGSGGSPRPPRGWAPPGATRGMKVRARPSATRSRGTELSPRAWMPIQ